MNATPKRPIKPEKPFTTPPLTAILFWCTVFGGLIALICSKLDHR